METARLDLSEEAETVVDFFHKSHTIMVHRITAGVVIFLGNLAPKTSKIKVPDWVLFPRMLCSHECFKELVTSRLLIRAREYGEEAYTVVKENAKT
jgi:hypothetical protein